MIHQLTPQQTWAQTLLFIIYQPMVSRKTGKYPLQEIVGQFPLDEQAKVRSGLAALQDLNIVILEGADICITSKSEALFHGLSQIAQMEASEVASLLESAPSLSALLSQIDREVRLAPPLHTAPTPTVSPTAKAVSERQGLSLGQKIYVGIFLAIILSGLLKVFVR